MKRTGTPRGEAGTGQSLGSTLEFMRLVWALHHGLEKGSRRMERSLGVTGQQRLVLRIIGRFPGISAGRLARVLHIHPSTLTGLLKRLERRSLIARRGAPDDGRLVVFALSARGRRVDARSQGTIESVMARALADLPPGRLDAARQVLALLSERLIDWAVRKGRH